MLLMGVPLLLLPLAARGFRPRGIAVSLLAVALMWQALPAVAGWRTAAESRAQDERFWYPVIAWLESHPDTDHRVQVVATADNWEAYYLARRGVPLARGWFRQDDFPANQALYEDLTPRRYMTWLHRTGVRWVLPPRRPARLQRPPGGRAAALGALGPGERGADRRVDRLPGAARGADRDPRATASPSWRSRPRTSPWT